MLTYLVLVLTSILAGFQFWKDWGSHQTTARRVAVFVLIVSLMAIGLINASRTASQHRQEVERAKFQHDNDEKEIMGLKQAVTTANENQTENTKVFLKQMEGLSHELANIKTQVKTQELRAEVSRLQVKLDANVKAMQQPKAALTWTFAKRVIGNNDESKILETTTSAVNGVVKVGVNLINDSPTAAVEGTLTIAVCDACRWINIPPMFRHVNGAPEQQIAVHFAAADAKSIFEETPLEIGVPMTQGDLRIAMWYRCNTCNIVEPQILTIHLVPSQVSQGH